MEFTGVFPPGVSSKDCICKSYKINSVTKNDFSGNIAIGITLTLYNTKDRSVSTLDTFFEMIPTDVECVLGKTKTENFIKFKIVSDVIFIPHTEKE